jgi:hypothetical protein
MPDNRSYLVQPWDGDNVVQISTLLHELVHYVQLQSSNWPCPNVTVWQACKYQDAWLQERELSIPSTGST